MAHKKTRNHNLFGMFWYFTILCVVGLILLVILNTNHDAFGSLTNKRTMLSDVTTARIAGFAHMSSSTDAYDQKNSTNDIDKLPVVLLVTYRESLMGCGDYHLYLSNQFETIYCFPDEYAKQWKIDILVENANKNKNISLGAHLLTHASFKGEFYCRREAIRYIQKNKLLIDKCDELEYFASWNCEVKPFSINKQIGFARPLTDDIKLLMKTFEFETNRRKKVNYNNNHMHDDHNINQTSLWSQKSQSINNIGNDDDDRVTNNSVTSTNTTAMHMMAADTAENNNGVKNIFAVTPTLWDHWFEPENLINGKSERLKYHARQVDWNLDYFKDNFGKPDNGDMVINADNDFIPWISDTLLFCETHAILYRFDILSEFEKNNDYMWRVESFMDTFIHEPANVKHYLDPYNMTVVRSNDVNVRIAFGNDVNEVSYTIGINYNYNQITNNLDEVLLAWNLDITRHWHWQSLSYQLNPNNLTKKWINAYSVGFTMEKIWGLSLCAAHWDKNTLLPKHIIGSDINEHIDELIVPLMSLCGYELMHHHENEYEYLFEMTYVYPSSIYITDDLSKIDADNVANHLFFQIEVLTNETKIVSLYAVDWGDLIVPSNACSKCKYDWIGLMKMDKKQRQVRLAKNSKIVFIDKLITYKFQIFKSRLTGSILERFYKSLHLSNDTFPYLKLY